MQQSRFSYTDFTLLQNFTAHLQNQQNIIKQKLQ